MSIKRGGAVEPGTGLGASTTRAAEARPLATLGPGILLRNAWVYLGGLLATAYFAIGVNVHYVLRTRSRERFAERATARWAAVLLRLANVRTTWESQEHLHGSQAQVLVANHQSWFDVFALAGTLPVKFTFVGKKELSAIPIFGNAWELAGHYPVDRSRSQDAMASLRRASERIRPDATTVVMFPEGTRSPTGELTRFKKGAFMLAIGAQVPIVPVAILGTRRVMAKGRWLVRPGRVTIRVAPPISTEGMTTADRDVLTRKARDAVAAMMEEETPCRRS